MTSPAPDRAILPLWAALVAAVVGGLALDASFPSLGIWPLAFESVALSLVSLIGRRGVAASVVGLGQRARLLSAAYRLGGAIPGGRPAELGALGGPRRRWNRSSWGAARSSSPSRIDGSHESCVRGHGASPRPPWSSPACGHRASSSWGRGRRRLPLGVDRHEPVREPARRGHIVGGRRGAHFPHGARRRARDRGGARDARSPHRRLVGADGPGPAADRAHPPAAVSDGGCRILPRCRRAGQRTDRVPRPGGAVRRARRAAAGDGGSRRRGSGSRGLARGRRRPRSARRRQRRRRARPRDPKWSARRSC